MINLGIDEIIKVLSIYTGIIVFILSAIVIPIIKYFIKKYLEDVEKRFNIMITNYENLETRLEGHYVKRETCELKHEPITSTLIRLQQDFNNLENKLDRGFEQINKQLIEIIRYQKNGK